MRLTAATVSTTTHRVSFRKLSKGGNWRNLDFKGGQGMIVKDVTKFHKRHLGGRGMLECVCACACRILYKILSFWKEGSPKFGVDVEGVYSI